MKKYILLISTTLLFLSSSVLAKKDKEYVVITAEMPWLTNPPYLKDKDSLEFEINKDRLKKQFKLQAKKDCKLLDLKCREKLLYKALDKNPIKKRGTLDYVTENYLPIKGSKKQGLKLKKLLEELDSVRRLTRSTPDSMQEKGELTYEEISSEICLIEKVIGYFPKNRYCHGY